MGRYKMIKSDFKVTRICDNEYFYMPANHELYKKALELMAEDFNNAKLEQYLTEEDKTAKSLLGYTISDKITSIRMRVKIDDHGIFYTEIIFASYPHMIRFTKYVKIFLGNYLQTEFYDGWGEGFFDSPIEIAENEYLAVGI